ncbi:MAG: 3-deoxy-7-phosphoheptulonate synthase [Pseudomonadales bacterium]|nr:3-deoxy-7-phosphoheptulonate synthase [Pseudomonadales bacterium]
MKYLTDDVRITGMEEVIAPAELIAQLPIDDAASELIFSTRAQISQILRGEDPRLLVVIGPCSIHDPKAALEYADRLAKIAAELKDQLHIIMRVYFEKPRTTVGWKGLINDPHLNDSCDINHGLAMARGVLRDITARGLGTGTEFLDPITPQYLGDLVSWGAIGARTTESQVHRQLASGLSCPIGFKNSTDGSIQVAVDAIGSAAHPHVFLSVTKQGHSAIFSTAGNEDCHVILRGGGGKSNYDNPSVHYASRLLEQAGLNNRVMIDMSHANSDKDFRKQLKVCDDLCRQISQGENRIFGVMIESNLVEGKQKIGRPAEMTYGQSITDGCLSWEDSERCLRALAEASDARRALTEPLQAQPIRDED